LKKEGVDALCEPNYVAMLLNTSFFLNDEGATDDAWHYCITALTRNYQEISKALDRAIVMLEGPILRWENQDALFRAHGDSNSPPTAISRIVHSMEIRRLPGGIIKHGGCIVTF